MKTDEFKEVVLKKTRSDGLVISRLPKPTRDEFIEFANHEFSGDYGMALKHLWDSFKLWKIVFENIDLRLGKILDLMQSSNEQPKKSIKFIK